MKKNDILSLECCDIGSDMEGICHFDGKTVFVPGMLPDEKGKVRIERVTSSVAFGKLLQLEGSASPYRCANHCPSYPQCGGCTARHMTYEATLKFKQNQVRNLFHKNAHIEVDVPEIIGMANPDCYRNKTALPIGGTATSPEIGFYAPRTHRLVPCENCPNAMNPTGAICESFLSWMKQYAIVPYNEETGKGLVRHIVVRVNRQHQAMLTVVINGSSLPHCDSLIGCMVPAGVVSIYINQNTRRTNVIFGERFTKLYGENVLIDKLCGFTFRISPGSFFQVNPVQTEKLYQTALDFAQIAPNDNVVDLYCGAGTISLLLAKKAKKVTGIEVVPEAIENARENAKENGVENVEFILGTAEDKLPELVKNGLTMDVVVVDPPRKGLEPSVIDTLGSVQPKHIVYVSCNVATQARDVALLKNYGYHLIKLQSVDMFCYTSGVENVVQLIRNKPEA